MFQIFNLPKFRCKVQYSAVQFSSINQENMKKNCVRKSHALEAILSHIFHKSRIGRSKIHLSTSEGKKLKLKDLNPTKEEEDNSLTISTH